MGATLVSAWSGVEVEQTSMYGLRQYQGGARLLSHVDRKPTHAVSLIVNIAQNNLANPWPVEVFDDMPNRPSPLLDGQVDYDQDNTICTLSSASQVDEGRIGVGTVDCHDSRLGPHISPTLYKASSAQHLFQWWKATEDPNFIGYGYAKEMHDIEDDNDAGNDDGSGSPSLQNSEATKTNSGNDEL